MLKELDQMYKADAVVLACTELLLIPRDRMDNFNIVDPMDILVKESIIRKWLQLCKIGP